MVASIWFGPDATQSQADCSTQDATHPTIVGQNIALRGCTTWPANEPLTISLDVRDPVSMGLELWAADRCDASGCQGDPIWRSSLIQDGVLTFHAEALAPGRYVLDDPVHPMTARLDVTVG